MLFTCLNCIKGIHPLYLKIGNDETDVFSKLQPIGLKHNHGSWNGWIHQQAHQMQKASSDPSGLGAVPMNPMVSHQDSGMKTLRVEN